MKDGIEDIYGLSPLQEGMLFHSLYKPELGEYFEQLSLAFKGTLNVAILEKAWKRVRSEPTIETSFHWEGLERPFESPQESEGPNVSSRSSFPTLLPNQKRSKHSFDPTECVGLISLRPH